MPSRTATKLAPVGTAMKTVMKSVAAKHAPKSTGKHAPKAKATGKEALKFTGTAMKTAGASAPKSTAPKEKAPNSTAMKTSPAPKQVAKSTAMKAAPKGAPKPAAGTAPTAALPPNFQSQLTLIRVLRAEKNAVVDSIGCNMLADDGADSNYHHLLAAMLSAQTKDQATAQGMKNLKEKGNGKLSVKLVQSYTEEEVGECIKMVGFHKQKASNIKKATDLLFEKFNGEVPDTLEELKSLPGVGPKMAFLVLQEAFGKGDSGICVDVHVHKICNRLGWVKKKSSEQKNGAKKRKLYNDDDGINPVDEEYWTRDAEETRIQLESFLPAERWKTFNPLFVGLGQLMQQDCAYLIRRAVKLEDLKITEIANVLKEFDDKIESFDVRNFSVEKGIRILHRCGCNLAYKSFDDKRNVISLLAEKNQLGAVKFVINEYGEDTVKQLLKMKDVHNKTPINYAKTIPMKKLLDML